jgi:3-isopropylmalate/(R)-2-methylmalate dehydratase small subunit
MNKKEIRAILGHGIALKGNDIDTDRIIPARFLKCVSFDGLGQHVFQDDRAFETQQGRVHPFDDPRFEKAKLLVANKNFGCGSSREHAPQALLRWGIQGIVAESFAEIFFGNCLALGIPCVCCRTDQIQAIMASIDSFPQQKITMDLPSLNLTLKDESHRITIPEGPRIQLMQGQWDPTDELLSARTGIIRLAARLPYFNRSPKPSQKS